MARLQGASGGMELVSFYPKRYGEPFVVEGQGVRVAVRPVGGTDVTAHIDNGQVIYREAYPETDSVHVVSAGRSEEFLYLQNECAPREFAYELSEMSAGTRVELVKGEVRFTNKAGHGVKIEAPWLIEATGGQRAGAVRWELEERKSGALQRLRLVVAEGLSYPVLIDPSWVSTGTFHPRYSHTATLLPSGKVLVAGGENGSRPCTARSCMIRRREAGAAPAASARTRLSHGDAAALRQGAGGGGIHVSILSEQRGAVRSGDGNPDLTGSLGTARYDHTATLLPMARCWWRAER